MNQFGEDPLAHRNSSDPFTSSGDIDCEMVDYHQVMKKLMNNYMKRVSGQVKSN